MESILLSKLLNQVKDKEEFRNQLHLQLAKNNITGDVVDSKLLERVMSGLKGGKPELTYKVKTSKNGKVTSFYV